jgi:S-adenosylmethionine:tRNA ribosyltransferase-isomerase
LLVYKNENIYHDRFFNITKFIEKDSLIVLNNTKVIQARLNFRKETGAKIEIFCLEPYKPSDYEFCLNQTKKCEWKCTVGNLRKWKNEILLKTFSIENEDIKLSAKLLKRQTEYQIVEFSWKNEKISFAEILETLGETPIPPYLNRNAVENDKKNYQTIYSKPEGSVAAPTAGLHFTEPVFLGISKKQIKIEELTLHVGAGTFRPVKAKTIGEHEMHTETIFVSKKLINSLISKLGKIVAVGTTSLRTLETIYWLGVKIMDTNVFKECSFEISQWESYNLPQNIETNESLQTVVKYMETNGVETIECKTQIIIVPGYKFRIVNSLITNFHMPKSTLLLLIAAFIGNDWKKVYSNALENDYRFLSYGDSSILIRGNF